MKNIKNCEKKYFAYGSNMAPSTLKELGLIARVISPAVLHHYKLMMNKISKKDPTIGYANIVPCWGSQVHGILYSIADACHSEQSEVHLKFLSKNTSILDKKEGFPFHYEKIPVIVSRKHPFEDEIIELEAFTYVATLEKQSPVNLKITDEYFNKLNEGLTHYNFDESYRNETLELIKSCKI